MVALLMTDNTTLRDDLNQTLHIAPDDLGDPIPKPVRIVVVLVVAVTVILTNLLNLIVLRKTRQIPPIAKICVLNLSIADLTSGVVCMLPCIVPAISGSWPYGAIWCQAAGVSHGTCCAVSIWSLSVVSVDRYLAIKFPLRYHTLLTPRRCVTVLIALWLLGYVTFLMPIFVSEDWIYYQFAQQTMMCGLYWRFPWLCIVTAVYIPMASGTIILYTSVSVIKEAGIMSRRVRPVESDQNDQKLDMRATKILAATAIVYFTAWGPYVVSVLWSSFATEVNIPSGVQFSLLWLANSNSFMNVFIYSMIYKSFRSKAKQIISSILLCKYQNLVGTQQRSEQS